VSVARKVIDEPSEDIVANARKERADRRSPFARVALFVRQVFGELRKVVTPTRRELFSYTGVVLAFVVVMMALVYVLDLGFSALVNWAFGS
jgi:preprotein translocase subunit SecE